MCNESNKFLTYLYIFFKYIEENVHNYIEKVNVKNINV